jgi:hypothetical protein
MEREIEYREPRDGGYARTNGEMVSAVLCGMARTGPATGQAIPFEHLALLELKKAGMTVVSSHSTEGE